jgi:hypothetical protein
MRVPARVFRGPFLFAMFDTIPTIPDTYADAAKGGHHSQGNCGKKILLESSSSSSSSTSVTPSPAPMCNVCNRKRHPSNDCPFFSWHPYVNKDTRIPFPDSSKGKEFTLNHTKYFKYLDEKDLDSVTPYANRPQGFQLPPSVQAPKDSTSGQPKGGKSKGTDSDLSAINRPFLMRFICIVLFLLRR